MKVLFSKRFILPFESGICVIKHWKIHNYIQKDRYTETTYTDEKKQLVTKENNAYSLDKNKCIQNVSRMETQVRLGKVRKEKSISSDEDFLKDLKANREQANKNWNSWTNDDIYAWYIKPRIRIDSNFAYNNRNDTVCRIDIIDWDGDVVKKVGILGKHFLYEDSYSGNYLMEYNFGPTDSNLSVDPGVRLCPGTAKDFWDWDNETIKTDFRVYWYGTCEMWIDYVRVENQPSVDLHSGIFDERIRREFKETLIDCNQNTQYFIKCKINNLPCIDYITRILRLNEAPNNFSLIVYKPFYNDSPNEQNIASLHLEH